MSITLNILSYMLPTAKVLRCGETNPELKCVFLYQNGGETPEADALYIAGLEELSAAEPAALSGAVFAAAETDGEKCRELVSRCGCTLLLFPGGESLIGIHRMIQKAMVRYMDWINLVDKTVYTCNKVQSIIQLASEMFADPILAWNPAFELMATANTDAIYPDGMPALMARFLQNRGWSGDDVDIMIKKHDYLTKPARYMDVRLITPPNMMNCYSCARNFSVSGRIVMTAGVYFLDGLMPHPGKVDLVYRLFYGVMRFFEIHSASYTGSKKIYERFIMELIEGTLTSESDIRDRLSYLNFPYTGSFEVLVLSSANGDSSMALGMMRNYCKSYFRHAKFIEYRNHLVGLNNRARDSEEAIARRSEMFSDVNSLDDFSLGISSCFDCIQGAEKAFNQAKIALQYGKFLSPGQQYFRYEDYFVYHMLRNAQTDRHELVDCPDAAYIYKLRDMDNKKKGVDNEKLFVSYILSGCNTTRTAELMNLHRNSILYRIKQIETLLNIDLTSPETLFHMILGIKAVELRDALEKEKEYLNENW